MIYYRNTLLILCIMIGVANILSFAARKNIKYSFIHSGRWEAYSIQSIVYKRFEDTSGKKYTLNSRNDGKDFDFIDAEVVNDDKTSSKSVLPPVLQPIGSFINNAAKGIFKTMKTSAESVGILKKAEPEPDDRSNAAQLKRMRNEVDSAFANTGIIGGIVGQLVKSFGGLLLENLAEASNDVERVKRSVQILISQDPTCESIFGSGSFSLLTPTQSTMSSSTVMVNGASQRKKSLQLVIPLESASSGKRGLVQVSAVFESDAAKRRGSPDELRIEQLSVSLFGYGGQIERVVRVPVSGPGSGSGSGGRRGNIIDV